VNRGIPNSLLVVLSVIMLSSCGSGGSGGPCAQRSGTYRANYSERSGTCGGIPEQIVTIDTQPTVPPAPCTGGEIRYSADNCEVTLVNVTCPEDGVAPGATSTVNGKVTWSADASSGSGQLTYVFKASTGGVLCQSSYNIVDTRL
jgi:hypothetical protein